MKILTKELKINRESFSYQCHKCGRKILLFLDKSLFGEYTCTCGDYTSIKRYNKKEVLRKLGFL